MTRPGSHFSQAGARRRGLTLLEVMIVVVILGVVFLGFGIGLTSNAHVPAAVESRLALHTRLVEKMEDLYTLDFPTLLANSGLSDTVTFGAKQYARTVTVARIDANGDGSAESDFLEITVTLDGHSLKSRVTQP